jgi:hypothetical protein
LNHANTLEVNDCCESRVSFYILVNEFAESLDIREHLRFKVDKIDLINCVIQQLGIGFVLLFLESITPIILDTLKEFEFCVFILLPFSLPSSPVGALQFHFIPCLNFNLSSI